MNRQFGSVAAMVFLFLPACTVTMNGRPPDYLWGGGARSTPTEMVQTQHIAEIDRAWQQCLANGSPSVRFDNQCGAQREALVELLEDFWAQCLREARTPSVDRTEEQARAFLTTCSGAKNRLYVVRRFAREWRYNRDDSGAPTNASVQWRAHPPRHGLALSGGGLRSAAFSIGVMTGLDEAGQMDKFSVISAVSGGSYAAGWYYAQHYNSRGLRGLAEQSLLAPHGAYQCELANKGALEPIWRGVLHFAVNLAFAPFNLLANGIFGWHQNTTPARLDYEFALERSFFSTPREARSGFSGASTPWGAHGTPSFGSVRAVARELGLPNLIINTTAFVDDDRRHLGSRLQNTVYELGLERHGSEGFGYVQDPPDMKVSRAVAISGAALDSSVVAGASQTTLTSFLNQDLGYFIDNPKSGIPHYQRALHRLIPFPFYFFHHYGADKEGLRIYLTDGGHSENLGAYSLAVRATKHITIVDAEHDPHLKFDAYRSLQAALIAEHGMLLHVQGIEQQLREGCPEKLCSLRLATPVLEGSMGEIPMFPNEAGDMKKAAVWAIKVTYIKLSIDECHPELYENEEFWEYFLENREDGCSSMPWKKCPFPQQATSDQDFSPTQFRAYRDLGRWIVRKHYDVDTDVTSNVARSSSRCNTAHVEQVP